MPDIRIKKRESISNDRHGRKPPPMPAFYPWNWDVVDLFDRRAAGGMLKPERMGREKNGVEKKKNAQ
jgi:hypothetical protein